jgi:hypothetical protein
MSHVASKSALAVDYRSLWTLFVHVWRRRPRRLFAEFRRGVSPRSAQRRIAYFDD